MRHCEKTTKFWKKISHFFLTLYWGGIFFFKFLWPFQKTWTLPTYTVFNIFCLFSRYIFWQIHLFFNRKNCLVSMTSALLPPNGILEEFWWNQHFLQTITDGAPKNSNWKSRFLLLWINPKWHCAFFFYFNLPWHFLMNI